MIRLLPLLFLPLGCPPGDDDSGELAAMDPDIRVLVASLDFGEIEVGVDPVATYTFAIHNQGRGPLAIDAYTIDDDDAPFAVVDHGEPLVPAGGVSWVELAFDPQEHGSWDSWLHIDSDDPDSSRTSVALQGRGLAPQISLTPESWEPGTTDIGCEQATEVLVFNTGSADLHLLDLSLASATTELTVDPVEDGNGYVEGLLTVTPGEGVTLTTIRYAPVDQVSDVAYLTVVSDDPQRGELIITVAGDGELLGSGTDSFVQADGSRADLVVAVDRSQSMENELEQLPGELTAFVSQLLDQGTDLHMSVATVDDGCLPGKWRWFDASVTASEAELMIDGWLGLQTTANNAERAFMLWEAFLWETPSGGCNQGFLRDAADLHLLAISDDPEQSVYDWAHYLDLYETYEPGPEGLFVHGLGGDYPKGCHPVDAYTGIYEATVATGGEFWSICEDDWSAGFEALAERMLPQRSRFPLSEIPVPATIVVTVDDQGSTHWTHDLDANELVFEDAYIPDLGSSVEIEYALQPDCEG